MQIMNSGATMAALGELKKNDTTLGKELKKVASGMKVNSAGDGASEYAISEKMRVRLRSLDQDIENVQTGKNLVRTAEGGIQEIVNNLRSMKTMAIDSANDHNTDTDRATIDKEFQQRIEEIDDIANTTNYNGRLLLRGDYGDHYLYKNRPEGSSTVLSLSATSISSDGVYTLPVGFTGTVYVSGGQNIELRQEDSSTPLHDVYIVGPSGGNANIWLNGLNIENGNDASIIKFQGTDNHLTILGTNNINYLPRDDYNKAVINVGGGLTIEGTGTLNVKNTGIQSCAGIGTDQDEFQFGIERAGFQQEAEEKRYDGNCGRPVIQAVIRIMARPPSERDGGAAGKPPEESADEAEDVPERQDAKKRVILGMRQEAAAVPGTLAEGMLRQFHGFRTARGAGGEEEDLPRTVRDAFSEMRRQFFGEIGVSPEDIHVGVGKERRISFVRKSGIQHDQLKTGLRCPEE